MGPRLGAACLSAARPCTQRKTPLLQSAAPCLGLSLNSSLASAHIVRSLPRTRSCANQSRPRL
jgi:hypothetical protein